MQAISLNEPRVLKQSSDRVKEGGYQMGKKKDQKDQRAITPHGTHLDSVYHKWLVPPRFLGCKEILSRVHTYVHLHVLDDTVNAEGPRLCSVSHTIKRLAS